ncbi:hypothetical protein [Ralstonia soli]|uniref:Uncharacterized protein n=1 Tax=Ralstonia soli TaxID=2953896 RepID=A0ABT1AHS0_9RALS|nr:hypothetical protein [Ralstonia soli]MCO5397943.1 hypothetical protein [Ralstonia soli]
MTSRAIGNMRSRCDVVTIAGRSARHQRFEGVDACDMRGLFILGPPWCPVGFVGQQKYASGDDWGDVGYDVTKAMAHSYMDSLEREEFAVNEVSFF